MTKTTPANEKSSLGFGGIIVYNFAQFGGNVLSLIFGSWILFFYTDAEGGRKPLMSIGLLGAALMIGRVVDAFFDPTVGYWSDRTRTRIGRRRPFMIVSTPILCVSFAMLFNPMFPAGSVALSAYAIVLVSVFWLSFTGMMGPYNALLPEIAVSSRERVNLSTSLAVTVLLATAYQGMIVPKMVDKTVESYSRMAIYTAIAAFILTNLTVLFVKEKSLKKGDELANAHEKYSLFDAFIWTFKNKPFIYYVIASVCQCIGFASLTASIPFIVQNIMHKPIGFVGTVYLYNIPSFVISFVLVNMLTSKVSKVGLYQFCLLLLGLLMPLLYFVGNTTLVNPVAGGIGLMMLLSFPIAGNMILPNAILADIIDYDEKLTNQRREAIYFGVQGLLQKIATAVSQGIQSLLFSLFGYSAAKHLGINLLGPVAGVFGMIGFFVFMKFPLDEKTKDLKKK